ncbi:MAG TPA: polysaccharide deacetylase family protein [Solirubrobacteraceae bacterium]|nr:polysaccharide deacetylase family protein [Solirubrobacteraceae bacterium]
MAMLALTFDDGPDPEWTPRLLDVLRDAGAVATFFPIASRAAAHPCVISRILADGHEVGLHCEDHARHSRRSIEWGRRDTARALRLLGSVGVRPTLWRTPWGATAPWSHLVARENRLRIVRWTVDTHDWRGDAAGQMFRATRPRLRPGAIVLAHDGIGPGAKRTDARETVAYTRLIVEHASDAGLELRPAA